jgi:phospholipase D1/2
VFDVFLFDADFRIERPTRYYRQGLNLLQGEMIRDELAERKHLAVDNSHETKSLLGSVRKSLKNVIRRRSEHTERNGHDDHEQGHTRPSGADSDSSSSSSSSSSSDRPPTPLLDPSTNTNPIQDVDGHRVNLDDGKNKGKKKKTANEMSKHTFYIVNSQLRLKLFARSEVCLFFLPILWEC